MTAGKPPKVLLNVDDNEVGRYTKSRILRQAGFEVVDTATGSDAIRLAAELKPELILLDVKLPDINGIEVCRIIKRDHPEILVLQISASFVTEGDKVRGLEGGADSYLTQPIAPSELVASIRALLRIRVAEAALRESEQRFRTLFASMNEGFCIIEFIDGPHGLMSDYVHIDANPAYERHAGIPNVVGQKVRDMVPDEAEGWIDLYRTVLVTGEPIRFKRELAATGRHLELSAFRIEPAKRRQVAVLFQDITARALAEAALQELNETLEFRVGERTRELKEANRRLQSEMEERARAEEQLRQSQKMDALGQLTGGIAHDFNNMLAVVMAGLGLIERRLARGDTDVSKYTQGVLESAKRAADLTQRLLAFSRQQPLSPEPLDANKLVAKLSDLLQRTLGEAVKIETVLAAGLWRLKADPSQLESALVNLAVNARDAMNDKGNLTIETGNAHIDDDYAVDHHIAPGQYVMIAVSDTGMGMPAHVIERAFDPFFTTKGVGKGTGLGLSQVFGFVRQSNGHVKIYSEVEVGTTVKIYLPRYFGDEKVAAKRKRKSTDVGKPTEIILLVEDEARVRAMAFDALKEMGYSVIQAESGADALKLLEQGQQAALLFTDVVMPDMSGRELAEHATKILPDLKVLFTTGYTRNSIVHNSVLDRDVHFLQKPFSLEQLAAKVRGVLDTTT